MLSKAKSRWLSGKNTLLIIGLIGIVSIFAVSSVEMGETTSEVSVIKMLPADYNPYQRLYDEMLYPTVRISTASGIGSGVVINLECIDRVNAAPITTSGHSIFILTAAHVVGNYSSVSVTFYTPLTPLDRGELSLTASVVMTDTNKDLALLRITNPPISPFAKGGLRGIYSAKLAPKDYTPFIFTPVWAVGCSLGLVPRPSFGHLCALCPSREAGSSDLCGESKYWEISAPILPGNSGGPVFDGNSHEVIGIAVWVKVYHGQLVTTMAGIVPITEIYKFLNSATNTQGKTTPYKSPFVKGD